LNPMQGNGHHRDGKRSDARPHEEFLELCAISTTGELSEEEQRKLRAHLVSCPGCRQALSEFEAVCETGVPLLSSEFLKASSTESKAVSAETVERNETGFQADAKDLNLAHRNGDRGTHVNWKYVWVPFAAAVVLTAVLGIYSYQAGKSRGIEVAQTMRREVDAPVAEEKTDAKIDLLEQKLSDAGHDREVLKTQLAERDQTVRELRHEIEEQSAALMEVKGAQADLAKSLEAARMQNEQGTQEMSGLQQKLGTSEASLKTAQEQLDSAERAREAEKLRTASLTDQIKDLYGQLKETEQTLNRQQDLLADDRDIRELMGARDLYIAEVYDVDRDGATRKPYGRIFYTKGKSLRFYAYDLDQQPGSKDTNTFQAWGQSGPDRAQALNLGIFYLDNAAKKRWVVKFDDPHALEQINAVFVTVEPRGGSRKPDGKPLLFASLRIEPNHP